MSGPQTWVTASQEHLWTRRWRRRLFALALAAVFLIGIAAVVVGAYLLVTTARSHTPFYEDPVDHFKYGSIGSEPASGLPAKLWHALPYLVPEAFGGAGDYRPFGFLYEQDADGQQRDLPIGVGSRTASGLELVWFNCALCHTGTVTTADGTRQIMPGMPSNNLDLHRFIGFILSLADDPRVGDIELVEAAIEASGADLGWLERQVWRFLVLPQVREQLILRAAALTPLLAAQPPWGPGRVDTFNPYKVVQLKMPLSSLAPQEVVAAADFPSIYLQRPREGMQLHWDGNNRSLFERNLSAAIGAGVTPETVDILSIERVVDWLLDLPPPVSPALEMGGELDKSALEKGRKIYRETCYGCHGDRGNGDYGTDSGEDLAYDFGGEHIGSVTPIDKVGTDSGRFDSYTEEFARNQRRLFAGTPHQFHHFEKTTGYANLPLDGLWLRGPYLHNGSVPTLADLLEPPGTRPTAFIRGLDTPDPEKGGFLAPVCDPQASADESKGFCFDTGLPGNSNDGHLWGTELPDADKAALLAYLLTF